MPQPKLNRISADDLPGDLRRAHAASLELRGDATFFEVFGNHPELYRWYVGKFYGELFRGGKVDRRIKEIARLRLSVTHGCRFCNQGNRADALAAGLSTDDISAIAALESDMDTSHLSAAEKTVLRLADQLVLTHPDGELTAELYDELRSYFDDADILELGLVMGILSGVAKFLFAYDLVEKEVNCPFSHDSNND